MNEDPIRAARRLRIWRRDGRRSSGPAQAGTVTDLDRLGPPQRGPSCRRGWRPAGSTARFSPAHRGPGTTSRVRRRGAPSTSSFARPPVGGFGAPRCAARRRRLGSYVTEVLRATRLDAGRRLRERSCAWSSLRRDEGMGAVREVRTIGTGGGSVAILGRWGPRSCLLCGAAVMVGVRGSCQRRSAARAARWRIALLRGRLDIGRRTVARSR